MNVLIRIITICGIAAIPAGAISSMPPEAPAVITHPTAESRTALLQAVSAALNGAPVTLAEDALTHDSWLVIEHAQPRDSQGRFLNGREIGMPEQFRLVKRGSSCELVHQRTGKRQTLQHTTCEPVPATT